MNVSFIGSGNLAWHLAPALDNTDFAVKEIYSKHAKNASALVDRLYQGKVKTSLDFSASPSQIFIIAASDDAIEEIVQELILPDNSVLLHTSGSQPMSALAEASTPNIGVLYLLQTFTKNRKVDFKEIPIFIESANSETEKILMSMAKTISKNPYKISSSNRQGLHIAAVFASNFTNHMLTLSKEILENHKIDFELIKPLIIETLNKSFAIGPENAQTGPAKRSDLETLDRHLDYLSDDKALAKIYKVISQHIVDRYE